jgi:hypothetical protein
MPHWPIYTLEDSTRCPANRRLSGPHSRSGRSGEEERRPARYGNRNMSPQLSSPLPRVKHILARNKLPYCKHLMSNLLPQKIDLRHLARTIMCVCVCVCVCVCDVFTHSFNVLRRILQQLNRNEATGTRMNACTSLS